MIDFTNMPTRKKTYAGANGGKIAILGGSLHYGVDTRRPGGNGS